ncbi:hypothetical protein KKF34_07430 [Myxococcota bacterium]|nr:hypothetical protein [Myxococcota bacterium]MBU1382885.1 hypothetical protein [Myxococcota bacterium]MBU1496691.1 hypothetical protein [Myxococcota bacterium]
MDADKTKQLFDNIGKAVNAILADVCTLLIDAKGTEEPRPVEDSEPSEGRITQRQVALLRKIASERGWDWNEFEQHVKKRYSRRIAYLSIQQAKELIGELLEKGGRNGNTAKA